MQRYEGGERSKYFADDDETDLQARGGACFRCCLLFLLLPGGLAGALRAVPSSRRCRMCCAGLHLAHVAHVAAAAPPRPPPSPPPLQTLMKRTKYGDEGDMDKKLAAGIMKSQRYKQTDHDAGGGGGVPLPPALPPRAPASVAPPPPPSMPALWAPCAWPAHQHHVLVSSLLGTCPCCPADAEYDHDAGLEMLDRKSGKRGTRENAGEKEKLRQVREYNRFNSALVGAAAAAHGRSRLLALPLACAAAGVYRWRVLLGCAAGCAAWNMRPCPLGSSNRAPAPPPPPCACLLQEQCQLCFASKHRPRHLAVAIGQSTYLAVPQRGRLVPGHCVIVPAEHVASTRQVDEQVRPPRLLLQGPSTVQRGGCALPGG